MLKTITVVQGMVPADRQADFEALYAELKKGPATEGMVSSTLQKKAGFPELRRIETVWASREALDRMRAGKEPPKAPLIFHMVGASSSLEIFEVVDEVIPDG